jgi:hypothetical protein
MWPGFRASQVTAVIPVAHPGTAHPLGTPNSIYVTLGPTAVVLTARSVKVEVFALMSGVFRKLRQVESLLKLEPLRLAFLRRHPPLSRRLHGTQNHDQCDRCAQDHAYDNKYGAH